MSDSAFPRIKSVEPRSNYRVAISFEAGPRVIADLSEYIAKGGVFSSLQDENVFSKVRVGDRKRVIEWPEPKDQFGYPAIEIDAESLMLIAGQQRSLLSITDLFNRLRTLEKNIQKG